jgi:CHAT domain-containing protein
VLPASKPDGLRLVDLGDAERAERLVGEFRASLRGRGGEAGRLLRALLFDPLREALGGARRLVVAPDGELAHVPLEVLPTDDGRRVIDTYTINYIHSGRDVLRFGAEARGAGRPVVAGDLEYGLSAAAPAARRAGGLLSRLFGRLLGGRAAPEPLPPPTPVDGDAPQPAHDPERPAARFEQLPETRREAVSVAGLLGVPPWLGQAAIKGRLLECRSPRILHLATHGYFFPEPRETKPAGPGPRAPDARWESPLLRSGLALAGANRRPGSADGQLAARDVSGLDLVGTELVLLSACETAAVPTGRSVVGLQRSFLLAGARSCVTSLWRVPAPQRQEFLEDFYRRVLSGEPRAEALRAAQLALKAKHPEPIYWGAFVCHGDPGTFGPGR